MPGLRHGIHHDQLPLWVESAQWLLKHERLQLLQIEYSIKLEKTAVGEFQSYRCDRLLSIPKQGVNLV